MFIYAVCIQAKVRVQWFNQIRAVRRVADHAVCTLVSSGRGAATMSVLRWGGPQMGEMLTGPIAQERP